MLEQFIEQFAARTGMVIVRPLSTTPWFPRVSCLLANPVFLLHVREDAVDPEEFTFSEDPTEDETILTLFAPTFGPMHWYTLTDVIREQENQWDPKWSPPFSVRSIGDQLREVERRLEHIRESFLPECFKEFSTRVRSGHLSMATPRRRD